ncbi:MAG: class I SAM-dependent methyltransferase [Myxococcaceae bacterium]|nr:class I SAM-dependent methyltransferase [Myxococcaceae bacterium]
MAQPDWNAEIYHRVSEPAWQWGKKVLAALPLEGDEAVLDVGCGSGRLTALLAERLPRGQVMGVDTSQPMLDVAARELKRFGTRVSLVHAEAQALALGEPVDVVFSTATFHWVADHAALFTSLARALKTGGRLHAQWGGEGNLHRFLGLVGDVTRSARWSEYFVGFRARVELCLARFDARALNAEWF